MPEKYNDAEQRKETRETLVDQEKETSDAIQQKETIIECQIKETNVESVCQHKETTVDSQQKETDVDSHIKETTVESQQKETAVESLQNETDNVSHRTEKTVESQQKKTAVDSQQKEKAFESQQGETAVESQQKETNVDSQQKETNVDNQHKDTPVDSQPSGTTTSEETSLKGNTKNSVPPLLLPQILGCGISALVQVGLGMVSGYSGVTIPQLTTNSTSYSDVILDQQQVALFSSLIYLAAALGCLFGVIPTVRYGQRVTMVIFLPILFAGWIALALSTTVWMVQVSRFVIGLTIGIIESSSYQYTTEIAHSTIRGQMVGALDTMRQLGIMLVYALGITGLTWKEISLVCGCTTIPPVFIALLFLPNSPRWLATYGRLEEASKSLAFYRGPNYDIDSELHSITNQLKKEMKEENNGIHQQLLLMCKKNILKTILFLSLLLFAVQFTGNIVTIAYMVPIFEEAEVEMNPYTSAIIIGGIRVFGTICSLVFVDYIGRRPALIGSFLTCGISLTSLGMFFYLKDYQDDVSAISWLPLTSLVIFTFFSCIGHPTLNLVRGELLPNSVRSAAMPLLGFLFFGAMCLASQTFPMMTSALEEYGAFWIYGAINLFMVITIAIFIPETRNKSLESIGI